MPLALGARLGGPMTHKVFSEGLATGGTIPYENSRRDLRVVLSDFIGQPKRRFPGKTLTDRG
jgi:hypothetical protein